MKTSKPMFTTLLCSGLLILAAASSAMAADRPTARSEAMTAQISVTRDAIQQVLAKMRNVPSEQNGAFSNPDFLEKAQSFNVEAEKALADFQKYLEGTILKQAAFWVDRLQAIQSASAYSTEQKKALFDSQLAQARVLFEDLSGKYAMALYKLYTLHLPQVEMSFPDRSYNCNGTYHISSADGRTIRYVTFTEPRLKSDEIPVPARAQGTIYSEPDTYLDCTQALSLVIKFPLPYVLYFEELRAPIFASLIRKGCYSSSCLALYANHRMAFMNLIHTDLDKTISFSVGGQTLVLNPLNLRTETLRRYFMMQVGDGKDLPFDISDSDYEQIRKDAQNQQWKQQRAATIKNLKETLLTPPGGPFTAWPCPSRVAELKSELCRSELGCLSDAEFKALHESIESADVYKKSARVACLNGRTY